MPESSSFWESLLGALIGAAAALAVYYLKTKREKKKEKESRLETNRNNLTHFSLLLETILSFGERQSEFYLEHSNNLLQKPLASNLLPTVIAEDLNRALNKFNHESLFHSYLEHFGNDEERIRKLQKIFSKLDYLYKQYDEANMVQERFLKGLNDKLLKYKDLTEEQIISFCSALVNEIKHTVPDYLNNDFYNLLNQSLLYYYENKPNPLTLEYIQEGFINSIKIELVQRFRNIQEANEIANNCRKATWLFNETKIQSKETSDEFKKYYEGFKSATEEFKDFTQDLLDSKKSIAQKSA